MFSKDLTPETRSLMQRFLVIQSIRFFAFDISSMFIILYLLDTLKTTELGLLFAVNFVILTFFDYPTGVLGDVIGHKKVMLLAYSFHIMSFILLIFSSDFIPLLLYSALAAFAASQESGALESWFDNNYNIFNKNTDPENKLYTNFQAKKGILSHFVFGISLIFGGLVSQLFSRKFLFRISLFFILITFICIFIFIKDYNTVKQADLTIKGYISQFWEGFRFLFSQKGIFFFFIGSTIIFAANNSIWINFLLFKIYEGYSGGEDYTTALFRALIFASGIIWQFFIVKFIHKMKRNRMWIFITTNLSNSIFFLFVYVYYLFFPPIGLDFFLLIGLFIIFQLPGIWEPLEFILRNQLNLELVPDNLRNSIYSLLPTLTNLIGIFGALLGGYYLKWFGFAETILFTAIFSTFGSIITGMGLLWLPIIIEKKKDVEVYVS